MADDCLIIVIYTIKYLILLYCITVHVDITTTILYNPCYRIHNIGKYMDSKVDWKTATADQLAAYFISEGNSIEGNIKQQTYYYRKAGNQTMLDKIDLARQLTRLMVMQYDLLVLRMELGGLVPAGWDSEYQRLLKKFKDQQIGFGIHYP